MFLWWLPLTFITTVINMHMVTTVTFIAIGTNVATSIMAMLIIIVTNASTPQIFRSMYIF